MKLFLHRFSVFCILCVVMACVTLISCQDITRRLDDKYRPVQEEGSASILPDKADAMGVPIRLVNMSIDDLELKVSSVNGEYIPFTPIIEESVQAGFARISMTEPSNMDTPFGDFIAQIDLCSKASGNVLDSYIYTVSYYPWRIFEVDDELYKFEQVKLYHCEPGSEYPENNSPTHEPEEMIFNDSIMTLQDKPPVNSAERPGTTVVCKHTGNFVNNGYDYFEIKFRSAENVASIIKLTGGSGFTFTYDSGALSATGGSGLSADQLNYDDSSSDWVTLGFWNSAKDTKCLFVENFVGTAGTATAASLSGNAAFAFFNVDSDDDSPTEVDYVAFYKRVSE